MHTCACVYANDFHFYNERVRERESEKLVNIPIWEASAMLIWHWNLLNTIEHMQHEWIDCDLRLFTIHLYIFSHLISFELEKKRNSNRKMCAAPNTHAHIYIKPMTHFHSHSHSAILNLTRLISKVLNHQRNRFHAFTTTLFVYACVRILSKTINCATVICNKIRGVVKIEKKTERESEIILKIEINIWT